MSAPNVLEVFERDAADACSYRRLMPFLEQIEGDEFMRLLSESTSSRETVALLIDAASAINKTRETASKKAWDRLDAAIAACKTNER